MYRGDREISEETSDEAEHPLTLSVLPPLLLPLLLPLPYDESNLPTSHTINYFDNLELPQILSPLPYVVLPLPLPLPFLVKNGLQSIILMQDLWTI